MMKKKRGFTLIELVIVVAIIGVLAAITYPSYQGAMRDSRRATAQADLMELASFMERYYTTNSEYTGAGLPFAVSPQDGNDGPFYDLTIVIPSGVAFTLTATPTGAQAGDHCGTLTLDNTDTKVAAVAGCW